MSSSLPCKQDVEKWNPEEVAAYIQQVRLMINNTRRPIQLLFMKICNK